MDDIIQDFTPYEKWMYFDNESTSSFPSAGYNYAKIPPVSGSFDENYNTISGNATILTNNKK